MSVGQMDHLTGTLRRLVFRISELLEADPTEGETERAPTSEWAYPIGQRVSDWAGASVKLTDTIDMANLTWYVIPFNEENFDKAGDFDVTTHKFTCSVAGVYLLSLLFFIYLEDAATLHTRLKVDGLVKLQTTQWNDKVDKLLTYPASISLELAVGEVVHWEAEINTDIPGGTAKMVGEVLGHNALFLRIV